MTRACHTMVNTQQCSCVLFVINNEIDLYNALMDIRWFPLTILSYFDLYTADFFSV